MTLDPELAAEAKSIVALAFRNGPIENVHAGKRVPQLCWQGRSGPWTPVYKLLWLKQNDAEKYEVTIKFGNRHTRFWDEPKADVG